MAALVFAHFICLVIKYYMVNVIIVMDSTVIHEKMIETFLRIHSSFFDTTPSGVLINKFTTDLGVLDNSLMVAIIDAVDGPILIGVALFNTIHIDWYFAIPAAILAVIIISFFIYSRPSFIMCKQLDLQSRGPIFHFFN
jgi:ATP-binding cassette, subfamily C (CFTR/MRP), member 4